MSVYLEEHEKSPRDELKTENCKDFEDWAYVDSRWSCLVCAKCFFVGFVCFGIQNNYGVVHLRILNDFGCRNWLSGETYTLFFIKTSKIGVLYKISNVILSIKY